MTWWFGNDGRSLIVGVVRQAFYTVRDAERGQVEGADADDP